MLSARSFSVLCVVTVLVSLVAVFVGEESGAIPGGGKPLFPELMLHINEIEAIEAQSAEQRFVIERTETGWVVPEKSGYPADGDKVHRLLVGAAGLRRVEPKTSRPEYYPRLGVADPGADGSSSVAYRFKGAGGTTFAALIVGNSAPAKSDPELSEFYVRLPDESRSWLVEGKLPRGDSLIEWTQRKVIDIDRARVREVRVIHDTGDEVVVRKPEPADSDFTLEDMPADLSVDGQWKINDIGRLLADLELEDVIPRDAASLDGEPAYVVRMQTFDGLAVRMQVHKTGGKAVGVLSAEFKPATSGLAESAESQTDLKAADTVRAESDSLNARWKDWAYVLPGYKLDALSRTRDQLVKKPSDEGQSAPGG